MQEVAAHEAARKFGEVIAHAHDEPVIIKRYGRTCGVLMSGAQFRFYNELLRRVTRAEIHDAALAAAKACAKDEDRAIRSLYKLLRPFRRR
jgi:hypothetical protein